jgi:hypothetical protein
MNRLNKIPWLVIALSAALVLSACGGGGANGSTATVDTNPIFTEIASTALALQTQTVLAIPTATDTPPASPTPEPTYTPLFTDTPLPSTPTITPLSTNTPLGSTQESCDNLLYIADVTIPDGYLAQPNEELDKTWEVKNLGPCTWNEDYKIVYSWGGDGTDWNTFPAQKLGKVVAPGETVNITITLRAPTAHGDYGGVFNLQNDKGVNFPPDQALTILITVQ